jgi:hypothetical protein
MRIDTIWRPLLGLFSGTEEQSYVEIDHATVHFRFGSWFDRSVPVGGIESVSLRRWPWWLGVGWRSDLRGTIGLIGSTMGVVEVALREPLDKWGPFRCERIAVSLEDPEGFMDTIARAQRPAPVRATRPKGASRPKTKAPARRTQRRATKS